MSFDFDCSGFGPELQFILEVIEESGKRAMAYFESGVDVVRKDDGSPVTRADKEIEQFIRSAIEERFPDDGILGEEEVEKKAFIERSEGVASSGSEFARRWIVDPIDGTFNFARGIPIFSTLMAFESGGDITVGAVYNPANGDLYYAERGKGAFKNGSPIRVSTVDQLGQALMTFGGPDRILKSGLWDNFTSLIGRTYRQRGFGDYLGFALVFEGKAEAMIEVGVQPWDLAPMKIIVEEAGGVFQDLAGGSSFYQGSCIVSNSLLSVEFRQSLLGARASG